MLVLVKRLKRLKIL